MGKEREGERNQDGEPYNRSESLFCAAPSSRSLPRVARL